MALSYDLAKGRMDQRHNTLMMRKIIRGDDGIIPNPTKPKLSDDNVRSIININGESLLWLRDQHGIIFPDINYDSIDLSCTQTNLEFDRIEDLFTVDSARKDHLWRRAKFKASLPMPFRRWAARW